MKQCVFFICFFIGTNIFAIPVEQEARLEELIVSQMVERSSNVIDFLEYLIKFFGFSESSNKEVEDIKIELKNTQEKVLLLTESNEFLTQENVALKSENQALIKRLQLEHDQVKSAIRELLDSYNKMIEQKDILKDNLDESRGQLEKKINYINQQYQIFLQVIADLEME